MREPIEESPTSISHIEDIVFFQDVGEEGMEEEGFARKKFEESWVLQDVVPRVPA